MLAKTEAAMREHGGGDGTAAGNRVYLHSKPNPSRKQAFHGHLSGDVWVKTVKGSEHRLQVPPGWAVDVADFKTALSRGARLLCIRDLEAGRAYWARLDTIAAHGFVLQRGFGEQLGLPLAHWMPDRDGTEAHTVTEPASTPTEAPLQLGLFGGAL